MSSHSTEQGTRLARSPGDSTGHVGRSRAPWATSLCRRQTVGRTAVLVISIEKHVGPKLLQLCGSQIVLEDLREPHGRLEELTDSPGRGREPVDGGVPEIRYSCE